MLGAVLYWLLLPFALLAGEWGRARGRAGGCVPAPHFPERRAVRGRRGVSRDARPSAPAFQRHESAGRPGPPSERRAGRVRRGGELAPWHPRVRAGECRRCLRGARGVGSAGPDCLPSRKGWSGGEGARISFSLSCQKKKKKKNEKRKLHHDFLTNLGEGGLPAWISLIWNLRSRANGGGLGPAPHPSPSPRAAGLGQA